MRRLLTLILLAGVLSGCLNLFGASTAPPPYVDFGWEGEDATGEDPEAWPDLQGVTLEIMDAGGFEAFEALAVQFQELTGVVIEWETIAGPQKALEKLAKGNKDADVIMGLDQMFILAANELGRTKDGSPILDTYEPLLGDRVPEFMRHKDWVGTPFEQQFYALNWAEGANHTIRVFENGRLVDRAVHLNGTTVSNIFAARELAHLTAVEDPRLGTPGGQAFLWTLIAFFGDDPSFYDWQEFMRDAIRLPDVDRDGERDVGRVQFHGGAEDAFFGFAKSMLGNISNRPIVWMPTAHAAIANELAQTEGSAYPARAVLADRTTWHRINNVALLNGSDDRAAGQAWMEFLLTDYAQNLLSLEAGTYPVVAGASTEFPPAPEPGTFKPAKIDPKIASVKALDWLDDLDDLCRAIDC